MASSDDFLERLWTEVINLDPKGEWITRAITECALSEMSAFSACAAALEKFSRRPALREHLGRVGRFIRYETCFGALYSLSDPGLKKDKLAGLHEKLLSSNPRQLKGKVTEQAFFESLWENISLEDDGKWLADLAKQKGTDAPFGDTGASVKELVKAGATPRELGSIAAWHRYDACFHTLRLLQEAGIESASEADGLYEMLLGADPSGLEGRPGSWPVQKKKSGSKSKIDSEPLWRIRSVQACAFSPDSKTLAVAGASSPVRLFDLASGKERLSCEGLKVHIYRIAFSPDGRQVAAGKIHKEITVCDPNSGKLLHKLKRTEDEISALHYAAADELLCSSWCNTIYVFDPRAGKQRENLVLKNDCDCMVNDMALSPDKTKLLVLWEELRDDANRAHATIWTWPKREQQLDVRLPDGLYQRVAWVPGAPQFAVRDDSTGIAFFDAHSGKRLSRLGNSETDLLTFTPDGKHLLTSEDEQLVIWDSKSKKKIKEIDCDSAEAAISPDGKYLVAVTPREALVWRMSALIG